MNRAWVWLPGEPNGDERAEWMTKSAPTIVIDGNRLTVGDETFVLGPDNRWRTADGRTVLGLDSWQHLVIEINQPMDDDGNIIDEDDGEPLFDFGKDGLIRMVQS